MLDIFNSDAFSAVELTDTINEAPNMYGRVRNMGLFKRQGTNLAHIALEKREGVLNILPFTERGGPATKGARSTRNLRNFSIPNISHEETITAADVEGVRRFGTENQLMSAIDLVNDKLEIMNNKFEITEEWLLSQALHGKIRDADGTVILDLFSEFGVSLKTVDFKLGTSTTDIRGKCMEVYRHVEDNLLGEVYTGIHALVDQYFLDKLVNHDKVKEAFRNWQAANNLKEDVRSGFKFGGIMFEEYRGKSQDAAGNTRTFIEDTGGTSKGEGRAFPLGTLDTFKLYDAPADFLDTVNGLDGPGRPRYARMAFDQKYNRWAEVHAQANPLPMVKRPALLVRIYSSD